MFAPTMSIMLTLGRTLMFAPTMKCQRININVGADLRVNPHCMYALIRYIKSINNIVKL